MATTNSLKEIIRLAQKALGEEIQECLCEQAIQHALEEIDSFYKNETGADTKEEDALIALENVYSILKHAKDPR